MPDTMYIAVMGATGSGKSSFISLLTDQKPAVGHSLESCTEEVGVYESYILKDRSLYLIDTPGFDDTNRSDTEVLRELAGWLTSTYSQNVRLTGIIYFHRISNVRMTGSAKRNIFTFRKLCGDNALPNVVLATSMWDDVPHETAVKREKELIEQPEWWGHMINKGSRTFRHDNTRQSAITLVKEFLQVAEPTVVLSLQEEMVDDHKTLEQTSAGVQLNEILAIERARFQRELDALQQDFKEALRLRDEEATREIEEATSANKAKMEKLEVEQTNLQVKFDSLAEYLEREYEAKLQKRLEEQNQHHAQQLAKVRGKKGETIWRWIAPLRGHTGWVNTLAFTTNGELLLSGSEDGSLRVWNVSTGIEKGRFTPGRVRQIAVSSQDDRVFCLAANRCVHHASLKNLDAVMETEESVSNVKSIAYDTQTNWIAAATEDKISICMKDAPKLTWWYTKKSITCIATNADGSYIRAGTTKGKVIAYSLSYGKVKGIQLHADTINAVRFSPDGQFYATASADLTIKVVGVDGGRIQTLKGHAAHVTAIAFSSDGYFLASGDSHGSIWIWDLRTTAVVQKFYLRRLCISALEFSPQRNLLACASRDRTIHLLEQISVESVDDGQDGYPRH
ncbi:WD40-repeat-containing domain protein [Aspergillus pseudoustus]|uniref:WD40-repeat-containing domain protein n=1 Tax=Aspergillus pseudoustus TaxID=1810923 RepID=A0ABR4KGW7_9EURO